MSTDADHGTRAKEALGFSRWWLIVAAAGMMAVVGPYQYVWSSLRSPVARHLGVDTAVLSTVFTLFVIFQAGSQFPVGWWRDRHGPRAICVAAAFLAGGGYVALAYANTVWQVYLFYSLGAIGVGIVYTIAVNTALKWFPDRRGLTSGIGTMAFAAGPAALVPYVRANTGAALPASSFVHVLQTVGALIFLVVLAGAFIIRDPPSDWLAARGDSDSDDGSLTERGKQYEWREMLRTWQFWLMYGMFVAVSGSGLMLTEKIVDYADHLGLAAVIVTLAATLLPLSSAVGRLVLGEASDRFDPAYMMATSFLLCGLGLFAVVYFGIQGMPAIFVAAVVVATFFWSPKYTLFPTLVANYYGSKHSSANYALLYSGKMWGGVLGGAVTGLFVTSLGWNQTFLLGGALAVIAGVASLALRPPAPSTAADRSSGEKTSS
ncbi:OFA family MFS transporter [Halarchaeum nitratireducens]|uniref:MFS transporter n=1 Tax=Halarchaeum nitratireducens TaxID=489913 RepID=A0A830GFR8_9EURY|nr:OFA family MFS transporter [Halarchaeum nitratireducens]GGN24471.1 MFS transporter [Halarchaeum nitratireducens]